MKERHLLYLGIISPIIFWITTIVCGLMLEDYNHFTWLVSELGALGTRTQYLFTAGLVLSSILNIFFVIGLYKYCKMKQLSVIPILFILLYSFLAGPALFPMPLKLHSIVGLPFPLIILAPILSLILWRKKEHLLKIRAVAIISFIIMLLGFSIFFPNVLNGYFGLKQRFLYAGWTVWSVYLAFRFLQLSINDVRNAK
ncbi:DUF998 domain-containing protein [Lutibacter sp. B1]|uniref:DUF998 domain-containing protein n=1 Tax=Lutibacter sp. B1 TaxID=2725996 RepID=UPI001456543F|nr:DUF998 domain-containing protein [Lutibacter sp. B1]NLP57095.1 DUF998 domain-containing protein [Lutibacter sp. B1]